MIPSLAKFQDAYIGLAVVFKRLTIVLLEIAVIVVVAGNANAGNVVAGQEVVSAALVNAGLFIQANPRTVRNANFARHKVFHAASLAQHFTVLRPNTHGITILDALCFSIGCVQEHGVCPCFTQPGAVVEDRVRTTEVVRVEQQVRILALFAADLAIFEGGLVARAGNKVLRIRSVVVVAQANAVEQVGLCLAGNLELAALGLQRVLLGVGNKCRVAQEGRVLVAQLALYLVTTVGDEFLQGHAARLGLALNAVALVVIRRIMRVEL